MLVVSLFVDAPIRAQRLSFEVLRFRRTIVSVHEALVLGQLIYELVLDVNSGVVTLVLDRHVKRLKRVAVQIV